MIEHILSSSSPFDPGLSIVFGILILGVVAMVAVILFAGPKYKDKDKDQD